MIHPRQQMLQHEVLLRGQVADSIAWPLNLVGTQVDGPVSQPDLQVRGVASPKPPHDGTNTRQKLCDDESLRKIIIRAGVQHIDADLIHTIADQHDDSGVGLRSHLAARSIHVASAGGRIKNHDVAMLVSDFFDRVSAAAGFGYAVALPLQSGPQISSLRCGRACNDDAAHIKAPGGRGTPLT
jgi:hypothetical protein